MSNNKFFEKLAYYYKKHGIVKLYLLACIKTWRRLFENRTVMFYLDFSELCNNELHLQDSVKVECYAKLKYIPKNDLERFYSSKGGGNIIHGFLENFFRWGAVLWLAKLNNELVGYYWSIKKGFNGFYNFPMTSKDAVLVAGEIFPDYRGRGINPILIQQISLELKKEGIARIFIGSKVWNRSQLRSIPKTNFKKLGTVRMFHIFGKFITIWDSNELKRVYKK